jgi:quinol monooxygenase YgiN
MIGSPAVAQPSPFFTATYVEVDPAAAPATAAALRPFRDAARKDEGNLGLEVLQRIDRPNQFVLLGAWNNAQAYEAHTAAAHTKKLNEAIGPVLAAPNDTRRHGGLALQTGGGSPDAIFVVTHVDVIPPQRDNGLAAVKQLAEDSRKHPGNLRFEVWQQVDRLNHFTVVEAWASRAAYDAHIVQPQTKDFRTKLATITGALYDERLYQLLP